LFLASIELGVLAAAPEGCFRHPQSPDPRLDWQDPFASTFAPSRPRDCAPGPRLGDPPSAQACLAFAWRCPAIVPPSWCRFQSRSVLLLWAAVGGQKYGRLLRDLHMAVSPESSDNDQKSTPCLDRDWIATGSQDASVAIHGKTNARVIRIWPSRHVYLISRRTARVGACCVLGQPVANGYCGAQSLPCGLTTAVKFG
jgi:hypothetical protein